RLNNGVNNAFVLQKILPKAFACGVVHFCVIKAKLNSDCAINYFRLPENPTPNAHAVWRFDCRQRLYSTV
ncbi:MAG: hypothetical protein J6T41_05570, partial [Neisseriaceae bacterium]|nr:hypothetical protein [Neisseriaceae bacterium]